MAVPRAGELARISGRRNSTEFLQSVMHGKMTAQAIGVDLGDLGATDWPASGKMILQSTKAPPLSPGPKKRPLKDDEFYLYQPDQFRGEKHSGWRETPCKAPLDSV